MNKRDYIYEHNKLMAKAEYHNRMQFILTSQIENEPDPDRRHCLSVTRSHHRRLYAKYEAMASRCWDTMGGV